MEEVNKKGLISYLKTSLAALTLTFVAPTLAGCVSDGTGYVSLDYQTPSVYVPYIPRPYYPRHDVFIIPAPSRPYYPRTPAYHPNPNPPSFRPHQQPFSHPRHSRTPAYSRPHSFHSMPSMPSHGSAPNRRAPINRHGIRR